MSLETIHIARKFAEKIVIDLQERIRTMAPTEYGPMNNTEKALNSLKYEVSNGRMQVYSDMDGYNYIWTLEYGRGPGKIPPSSSILSWMQQRGIAPKGISKESLAFLIARKIGREGSLAYKKGPTKIINGLMEDDQYFEDNFYKPIEQAIYNVLIAA